MNPGVRNYKAKISDSENYKQRDPGMYNIFLKYLLNNHLNLALRQISLSTFRILRSAMHLRHGSSIL